MKRDKPSRNSLDGEIKILRQGLAIYKVKASPYYRVRIWLPSQKKRVVRTTRADTRAEAIAVAEELFASMGSRGTLAQTSKAHTFEHFADLLVEQERGESAHGDGSARGWRDTQSILRNRERGLVNQFGKTDVANIKAQDLDLYFRTSQRKMALAPATLNRTRVVFSKVMKLAQLQGLIETVPPTPRFRQRDNPRPFFRFYDLVTRQNDEYQLLLKTAKEMAAERVPVRGIVITDELYDFILFLTHSFLRPTESEVYALTHRDIAIAENPKRLVITIRKGKTGYRVSNTMPPAVTVYNRIKKRHEGATQDDYLFLPSYKNRSSAKRIIQRQFNAVLERAGLKQDRYSNSVHTVYSLRHTAICMRLVLSKGKVNIFNLAKNAGTSVDQIERFYARNLPLSAGMVENLQTFGGED